MTVPNKERRSRFVVLRSYKRRPWTDADDEALISLFNDSSYTLKVIASEMRRSIGTIRSRLQSLREAGRVGLRVQPKDKAK